MPHQCTLLNSNLLPLFIAAALGCVGAPEPSFRLSTEVLALVEHRDNDDLRLTHLVEQPEWVDQDLSDQSGRAFGNYGAALAEDRKGGACVEDLVKKT